MERKKKKQIRQKSICRRENSLIEIFVSSTKRRFVFDEAKTRVEIFRTIAKLFFFCATTESLEARKVDFEVV